MTKAEARKQMLAQRKQLSSPIHSQLCQQITDIFFQHFNLHNTHIIHIFLPIQEQNEIDTFLIINQLQQNFPDIQLIIPRANPIDFSMEHYVYEPEIVLVKNQWGILEPTHEALSFKALSDIDMVLLPLVAFDEQGYRVGYGKGFYDRFLAKCRLETLQIGLSLFEPVPYFSDVQTWDIRMNYALTPKRVWQFDDKA